MLLRVTQRLLSTALLLVALIFFEALLVDLGQEGDLRALPSVVSSAAGFTASYLKGLVRGDLGLLAAAMALAVLVGLILGARAALRRTARFSGLLLFVPVLGISTPGSAEPENNPAPALPGRCTARTKQP